MLHLVTGQPGDGKTNWTISEVKRRAEKEGREVYCDGIDILDPVALPWKKIKGEEWYTAPVGSIVVIDEAQRIFRPRPRTGALPKFASELETHRHSGIDLYLITQDPSFIDSHDRKLTGTHHHMMRKFGTAWITRHEFKGVRENVLKSRKDSQEHEFVLHRPDPPWYKSTEQDTSRTRIPKKVWVAVGALAVAGVAFVLLLRSVSQSMTEKPAASASAPATGAPARPPAGTVVTGQQPAGPAARMTTAEYLAQHVARVDGLAYTAPVYDEITKPVHAPYPAACVASAARCTCYTQQGTVLATPAYLCKQVVENGFFLAWEPRQAPLAQPVADKAPEAPVPAVVGGGVHIGHTRQQEKPSPSILDTDQSQPGGRGKALPPPTPPNNSPLPAS